MVYTVGEMAKRMGVAASTLRYYDKEGLLPFVERSPGGIRLFRETDVEWLNVIGCLTSAGMSIGDIREYIRLAMQGDGTIALAAHHIVDVARTLGCDGAKQVLVLIGLIEKGVNTWFDNGHMR